MTSDRLRTAAAAHLRDLGQEPLDRELRLEWREKRSTAIELLVRMAGRKAELLRRAALEGPPGVLPLDVTDLLLDAARRCPRFP